jgi:ADP-ribosylglycohydrolase
VQLEAVDGGRNFEEAVLRAVNLGDRGRSGE